MRYGAVVILGMSAAAAAGAQSKTITGETKTLTATVEAIEKKSREVTVKKDDGKYEVFYVPTDVKRFDTLKIGDKVNAKYYENMVVALKAPGSKDADKVSAAVTKADGGAAGTVAHQQTITATISAIDMNAPSVTFNGPRGWTYSTRVKDKDLLSKVKVGDKVDITWTEAMVLSLDEGK
jgi:hypothetical protein